MPVKRLPTLRLAVSLVLCGAGGAGPVAAATSCAASATGLAFAGYNPVTGTALASQGTLSVQCTVTSLPLAPVAYAVSFGPSATNGTMARALSGPSGAKLAYNVYTAPTHLVVWGDGSAGTAIVTGSVTPIALGVPSTTTHTAYGRIPGAQAARPGTYADALLVTIDY